MDGPTEATINSSQLQIKEEAPVETDFICTEIKTEAIEVEPDEDFQPANLQERNDEKPEPFCFVDMSTLPEIKQEPEEMPFEEAERPDKVTYLKKIPIPRLLTAVPAIGPINKKPKSAAESMLKAFGKVACVYCGEIVQSDLSMLAHVNQFHPTRAIKCFKMRCDKFFRNEEERIEHVNEVHEKNEKQVLCIYCNEYVIRHSRHVVKFHPNEVIKCSFSCGKYFKTEEEKLAHQVVHEVQKEKLRKETQANEEAARALKIKEALMVKQFRPILPAGAIGPPLPKRFCISKTTKERPFPCWVCGKNYSDAPTLETHSQLVHKEYTAKCKFLECFRRFTSEGEADAHFIRAHALNERIFSCNLCSFQCLSQDLLDLHVEGHLQTFVFKCLQCAAVFNSEVALKEHVALKHEINACPHCKIRFPHLKVHMLAKICEVCCSQFPCVSLMNKHKEGKCKDVKIPVNVLRGKHNTMIQFYQIKFKPKADPPKEWTGLDFKYTGIKCDECKIYFKFKCFLVNHNNTVHINVLDKLICALCNTEVTNLKALRTHFTIKHGVQNEIPVPAELLAKTYSLLD